MELPVISYDITSSLKKTLSNLEGTALDEAVSRYKRFLFLAKTYPKAELVPTTDIDLVWHNHMLHPKSYYNDCLQYLGFILDHKPEVSDKCLTLSFKRTEELWSLTYNENYSFGGDIGMCGSGGDGGGR